LKEKKKVDSTIFLPEADDAFHDGRNVLQAVKDWHVYLRSGVRQCDTITASILDLAEESMLQADPIARLPSAELDEQLQDLLGAARSAYERFIKRHSKLKIPNQTLKSLLAVDDMTPPDVNQVATSTDSSIRQLLNDRKTRTKTSRAKKTERLESVPQARVARRQEVLNQELSEMGIEVESLGIIFESPATSPMRPEHSHEPLVVPMEGDGSPTRLSQKTSNAVPDYLGSASQSDWPADGNGFTAARGGVSDREDSAKIFCEPNTSTTLFASSNFAHPSSASSNVVYPSSAPNPGSSRPVDPRSCAPFGGVNAEEPKSSLLYDSISSREFNHSPIPYDDAQSPTPSPGPSYRITLQPTRTDTPNTQGSHTYHQQPRSQILTPSIVTSQPEPYYNPTVVPPPREPTPSIMSREPTLMDPSTYPPLQIGALHATLVATWKAEQTVWNNLINKVRADDKLKNFIRGRDIVSSISS
jgi:hypothetical protein